MKRILAVLLTVLMLLACQPTPEQDAVKSKDTNVLIDTVIAGEQAQQNADAPLPPVKEQVPARFQCDFTTAGGTRVVADRPIRVLTDGVFPVLRVERRKVTEAERLTLAKRLLGAEKLYLYHDVLSRKDIEGLIRTMRDGMTDEAKQAYLKSEGNETSWEELYAWRQGQLAYWQQVYRDLPTDDSPVPNQPWNGEAPDPDRDVVSHYTVVTEAEGKTNLTWLPYAAVYAEETDRVLRFQKPMQYGGFDLVDREGTERIEPEDYEKVHDGAAVSAKEAATSVLPYFDGILNLHVDEIYWSHDVDDGDSTGEIHEWAYVIRLTPDFDGAATAFCDRMAIDEADVFAKPWAYENVVAAVSGEGELISLSWEGPLSVTRTIARSTSLLQYDEVLRLFSQQMERMQFGDGATVTVTDVKLGLFRIREKDSMDNGLLVPAWVIESVWDSDGLKKQIEPLVINAIDGGIIDPGKGY